MTSRPEQLKRPNILAGVVSHFDDARPLSVSEAPHSRYDEDGKDVTDEFRANSSRPTPTPTR